MGCSSHRVGIIYTFPYLNLLNSSLESLLLNLNSSFGFGDWRSDRELSFHCNVLLSASGFEQHLFRDQRLYRIVLTTPISRDLKPCFGAHHLWPWRCSEVRDSLPPLSPGPPLRPASAGTARQLVFLRKGRPLAVTAKKMKRNSVSTKWNDWEQGYDTYDRGFGPLTRQTATTLLESVGFPEDGASRLLGVATGPGFELAAAVDAVPTGNASGHQQSFHLTGLDISQNFLALARINTQFPPCESKRVKVDFAEGSAELLPFPHDLFDCVVCNFGILHFFSPRPLPPRISSSPSPRKQDRCLGVGTARANGRIPHRAVLHCGGGEPIRGGPAGGFAFFRLWRPGTGEGGAARRWLRAHGLGGAERHGVAQCERRNDAVRCLAERNLADEKSVAGTNCS